MPLKPYQLFKRIIDCGAASAGIVVLSPFMGVAAVMVMNDSKGPILYRQHRIGKHGVPFTLYKFRTMTMEPDAARNDGITSPEKQSRITPLGKIMRKYRIDELPQLFNVVKGDMALVGPRPQIAKYMSIYPNEYARIQQVHPGITGLASILFHEREEAMLAASKNAEQTYIEDILPKKFRYEYFYLEKCSLAFDLKIMCWTITGLLEKSRNRANRI